MPISSPLFKFMSHFLAWKSILAVILALLFASHFHSTPPQAALPAAHFWDHTNTYAHMYAHTHTCAHKFSNNFLLTNGRYNNAVQFSLPKCTVVVIGSVAFCSINCDTHRRRHSAAATPTTKRPLANIGAVCRISATNKF